MDEPSVSVMETLLNVVGDVLTGFVGWFGTISTMMIESPVVQLMVGLGVASLLVAILLKIIGKATFRRSSRRR